MVCLPGVVQIHVMPFSRVRASTWSPPAKCPGIVQSPCLKDPLSVEARQLCEVLGGVAECLIGSGPPAAASRSIVPDCPGNPGDPIRCTYLLRPCYRSQVLEHRAAFAKA